MIISAASFPVLPGCARVTAASFLARWAPGCSKDDPDTGGCAGGNVVTRRGPGARLVVLRPRRAIDSDS